MKAALKYPNVLGRPTLRRLMRAWLTKIDAENITFHNVSDIRMDLEVFVIQARLSASNFEIGRVCAQFCKATKSCYIFDVIVEPQYRKLGVAEELLMQAMLFGGSEVVVPVTIVAEASGWWLYLAKKKTVPLRFGLINTEFRAIEHCLRSMRA